jgi:hypothetical protein
VLVEKLPLRASFWYWLLRISRRLSVLASTRGAWLTARHRSSLSQNDFKTVLDDVTNVNRDGSGDAILDAEEEDKEREIE